MKFKEFDKLFKDNFNIIGEVDSGGGDSNVFVTIYHLNKSLMFCAIYEGDEMSMCVPAEMLIDLGKVYEKYSELDYLRLKSSFSHTATYSGWIQPYDLVKPAIAA